MPLPSASCLKPGIKGAVGRRSNWLKYSFVKHLSVLRHVHAGCLSARTRLNLNLRAGLSIHHQNLKFALQNERFMDNSKAFFFFCHDVNRHYIASYRCVPNTMSGLRPDWLTIWSEARLESGLFQHRCNRQKSCLITFLVPLPSLSKGVLWAPNQSDMSDKAKEFKKHSTSCGRLWFPHAVSWWPLLSQEENQASALCLGVYSVQLRENGCK